MLKTSHFIISTFLLVSFGFAEEAKVAAPASAKTAAPQSAFKDFTGKVIGSHVRMRAHADTESQIISEMAKDDYVLVTGEKGDFFAVQPPKGFKAYIFRGFIIDDVVEGDRVNVRLSPDRNAPIIGHYSTGESLKGAVCENNPKWLEIPVPQNTKFFVAKEYIERAGDANLKEKHDTRKAAVEKLYDSANLLSQSEMRKAFNEIDIDRVAKNYQTIINEYPDFPKYTAQAASALAKVQEDYLHRKIAFLESKTSKNGVPHATDSSESMEFADAQLSPTDRMKVWEPVEESLYLTWSSMHHSKTMSDFYQDQKMTGKTISGIVESYREPVKNRPGDYIIKDRDVPVGYLYSTHVNLQDYLGKRVNLLVSERSSNHFAFPAFYVLSVE